MLHALSLMLRHQAAAVLPLLGPDITVVYLPGPCPLPVTAHDFSKGGQLVELGYRAAKPFLDELKVSAPGLYGGPHYHAD